jgi:hypothetical protein
MARYSSAIWCLRLRPGCGTSRGCCAEPAGRRSARPGRVGRCRGCRGWSARRRSARRPVCRACGSGRTRPAGSTAGSGSRPQSAGVNGCGSRASHLRSSASMTSGVRPARPPRASGPTQAIGVPGSRSDVDGKCLEFLLPELKRVYSSRGELDTCDKAPEATETKIDCGAPLSASVPW